MDALAEFAEFQRKIRVRNRVEVGAAIIVIAVFAVFLAVLPFGGPARLALVATMVAAAGVAAFIARAARVVPAPAGSGPEAVATHARAEMHRHAQLLSRAWAWYFLPLMLPCAAFFAAVDHQLGEGPPVGKLAGIAAFTAFGIALNLRGAWRLRQEADALA